MGQANPWTTLVCVRVRVVVTLPSDAGLLCDQCWSTGPALLRQRMHAAVCTSRLAVWIVEFRVQTEADDRRSSDMVTPVSDNLALVRNAFANDICNAQSSNGRQASVMQEHGRVYSKRAPVQKNMWGP